MSFFDLNEKICFCRIQLPLLDKVRLNKQTEFMERFYTSPVSSIAPEDFDPLVELAVSEDCPDYDITSESVFPPEKTGSAILITREEGIFCGSPVVESLLRKFPGSFTYEIHKSEGSIMMKGEKLLSLSGSLNVILRVERPLLNFLQYLSGIATTTWKLAREYPRLMILDTRKTLPGYRKLAKYAVFTGGGANHRISLSDMGLIKDNHVALCGSMQTAVKKIRERFPDRKVELEIDGLHQLEEAIGSEPDIILLDNFSIEDTEKAVQEIRKKNNKIRIECSGGITPEKLESLSRFGDIGVSMGYLTHTTRFLDLSLEIQGG